MGPFLVATLFDRPSRVCFESVYNALPGRRATALYPGERSGREARHCPDHSGCSLTTRPSHTTGRPRRNELRYLADLTDIYSPVLWSPSYHVFISVVTVDATGMLKRQRKATHTPDHRSLVYCSSITFYIQPMQAGVFIFEPETADHTVKPPRMQDPYGTPSRSHCAKRLCCYSDVDK